MASSTSISYRAVHAKTPWRKVGGHKSLQSALAGQRDGAPGLFARKVRINYEVHGEPLFAVIWEDGASYGYVVKKDSSTSNGTVSAKVPIEVLLRYEKNGGASSAELDAHFGGSFDGSANARLGPDDASLTQADEGAAVLIAHLVRERNAALAEAKKNATLQSLGRLECEACRFDFSDAYGEIGRGFCEIHHKNPLGSRSKTETTQLQELAVLCSNCHSMIHRTMPMWTVAALAAHVDSRRSRS